MSLSQSPISYERSESNHLFDESVGPLNTEQFVQSRRSPFGEKWRKSPYVKDEQNIIRPNFGSGRVTAPIKAIKRVIKDWNLDISTVTSMLGYESDGVDRVTNLLDGKILLCGRDPKDRIVFAISIHHALRSLFGDVAKERQWLDESNALLGDHSPIEFLKNGGMESLLAIKQLAELTAGR